MKVKKGPACRQAGFSFIELIVVVTIIALLSVVGAVSYSSVNKKSRDSRRISDLANMRMALEAIRQVGTTYPVASGGSPVGLAPLYIESIPKGPIGGTDVYFYTPNPATGGYSYTIWARMENAGSTNCPTACGTFYNYQVTSP